MKLRAYFNRDGGTFRTTDMEAYSAEARRIFGEAGHELDLHLVEGKDIVPTMEKAANEGGFDGLIAGGGDGTISAAAGIAAAHGVALGVVPAGTMNLFARSLRLPLDIHAVLPVLAKGDVEKVDIGDATGRPFVHQFSAGLHSRMVRLRNQLSFGSRLGKISASTRAAVGVILDPPVFEVEFTADGVTEHRKVSAISVSNNPFGTNGLMYADDLTGGQLGFYTTRPLRPAGVARLAADIFRGKLKENADVTATTVEELELHFPRHQRTVNCVMDGELLPMPRDVRLSIRPGGLQVLVGEGFYEPPPAA